MDRLARSEAGSVASSAGPYRRVQVVVWGSPLALLRIVDNMIVTKMPNLEEDQMRDPMSLLKRSLEPEGGAS